MTDVQSLMNTGLPDTEAGGGGGGGVRVRVRGRRQERGVQDESDGAGSRN